MRRSSKAQIKHNKPWFIPRVSTVQEGPGALLLCSHWPISACDLSALSLTSLPPSPSLKGSLREGGVELQLANEMPGQPTAHPELVWGRRGETWGDGGRRGETRGEEGRGVSQPCVMERG